MQSNGRSTELKERLSVGMRSVPIDANTAFVAHVLGYVADLPNSGSQQHRLRYGDRNWLIGLWRWIVEHRAAGTDWSRIRRILQACLDEIDVEIEKEAIGAGALTADAFAEAVKTERAAEYFENTASDEALHLRTVGTYRRVADFCNAQIEALTRKAKTARLLAARLSNRTA